MIANAIIIVVIKAVWLTNVIWVNKDGTTSQLELGTSTTPQGVGYGDLLFDSSCQRGDGLESSPFLNGFFRESGMKPVVVGPCPWWKNQMHSCLKQCELTIKMAMA